MDRLTYNTAGNLEREAGALEFWFQPAWNGGDNLSYVLFEVGDSWFNRLRVAKDGANNLRLMVWDSSTEYGVATNVAGWQAGEWHHIAATWQGSTLQLFVDGVLRDRAQSAGVPDTLANSLVVGAANYEPQWAHGVIDELRISRVPRLGNSDVCQPTIFVADSGNNRLQAFDSSGSYLGQIGSLGSGLGQFNQPQGVTVRPNGDIVVVDSGNNRLQLFTFDGQQFTPCGRSRPILRPPPTLPPTAPTTWWSPIPTTTPSKCCGMSCSPPPTPRPTTVRPAASPSRGA